MASASIWSIRPGHLTHFCLISGMMFLLLIFLYNSKVLILLGQKMPHGLARHPLWNASILFISGLVSSQHSEPYIWRYLTLLLYRYILPNIMHYINKEPHKYRTPNTNVCMHVSHASGSSKGLILWAEARGLNHCRTVTEGRHRYMLFKMKADDSVVPVKPDCGPSLCQA